MDLYSPSASIQQANSQTEGARALSRAAADFNNSLAEQLDQANLEEDEDKSSKLQKNVLSVGTSAGKIIEKNAESIKTTGGKALSGVKEIKSSLAERMAKDAGQERLIGDIRTPGDLVEAIRTLPEGIDEIDPERFAAGVDPKELQRITGTGTIGVPQAANEVEPLYDAERETVSGAAEGAAEGAEEGAEGSIKTGAQAIKEGEEAAKTSAKAVGRAILGRTARVGLAGVGGALDVAQDIDRIAKGGFNKDAFGSNNASRFGNIANVIGSGLEVAGVLGMAAPPIGIGLEALGAGVSLIGSAFETGGEIVASDEAREKTDTDITSQQRGEVAAAQVETAAARTV